MKRSTPEIDRPAQPVECPSGPRCSNYITGHGRSEAVSDRPSFSFKRQRARTVCHAPNSESEFLTLRPGCSDSVGFPRHTGNRHA